MIDNVSGFITRHGRFFHTTEHCPKYRYGVASARRFGRIVHPRQLVTAGDVSASGRRPCRACWAA